MPSDSAISASTTGITLSPYMPCTWAFSDTLPSTVMSRNKSSVNEEGNNINNELICQLARLACVSNAILSPSDTIPDSVSVNSFTLSTIGAFVLTATASLLLTPMGNVALTHRWSAYCVPPIVALTSGAESTSRISSQPPTVAATDVPKSDAERLSASSTSVIPLASIDSLSTCKPLNGSTNAVVSSSAVVSSGKANTSKFVLPFADR